MIGMRKQPDCMEKRDQMLHSACDRHSVVSVRGRHAPRSRSRSPQQQHAVVWFIRLRMLVRQVTHLHTSTHALHPHCRCLCVLFLAFFYFSHTPLFLLFLCLLRTAYSLYCSLLQQPPLALRMSPTTPLRSTPPRMRRRRMSKYLLKPLLARRQLTTTVQQSSRRRATPKRSALRSEQPVP
jgi:hypothetical protein